MLRGGMLAAVPTTSSPRCWIRARVVGDGGGLTEALHPMKRARATARRAAHLRDLI
jgi:hypothetical protein